MAQETKDYTQTPEFMNQKIIMMGGNQNQRAKQISEAEIKRMKQKYVAMYYGFVSIHWGMGKSLGASWQRALEQMDGFIATWEKIPNHPLTREMKKFHQEYRRDMARAIMTNPNAELKLQEKFRKDFVDYGTRRVKESKSDLDSMYKKYAPEQDAKKTEFASANRQVNMLLQQILLRQKMQGRAA
jgi:hypothetical protein